MASSCHVMGLIVAWLYWVRGGIGHLNFSRIEWACGGTGIRARLRSVSRKGWEFESPHAHSMQDGVHLRSAFRKDWEFESPRTHRAAIGIIHQCL